MVKLFTNIRNIKKMKWNRFFVYMIHTIHDCMLDIFTGVFIINQG